jgi:hypothetical protein
MSKALPPITIGSDPEFAVREDHRPYAAHNLFTSTRQHTTRGEVFTYVGTDGADWTGEIRPAPGKTVEELLTSTQYCIAIAKLISMQFQGQGKITLHAGAHIDGKPLGGHLHFGGMKYKRLYKTFLESFLNKTVGIFSRSLHSQEEVANRLISYGRFGDRRQQGWGTEWRVPSSWIFSYDLAAGFIELAFLLYSETLETKTNYGILRDFVLSPPYLYQIDIWSVKDREKIKTYAKKVVDFINTLYGSRLRYCAALFDMVDKGEEWNNNTDILSTWGLCNDSEKTVLPEVLGNAKMSIANQIKKLVHKLDSLFSENAMVECSNCKTREMGIVNNRYGRVNICSECGYVICRYCASKNTTCPNCGAKEIFRGASYY